MFTCSLLYFIGTCGHGKFSPSLYIPWKHCILNIYRLRNFSACGYRNRGLQIIFHTPLMEKKENSQKLCMCVYNSTLMKTLLFYIVGFCSQSKNNENKRTHFPAICVVLSPFLPTWKANGIEKNASSLARK